MAGLSPQVVGEYLLALFGNIATNPGCMDRRGDAKAGLHHETGLPMSAGDLTPRCHAVTGRRLALEHQILPRAFAAGLLRRVQAGPDGTEELVSLGAAIPEARWTAAEHDMVHDVTHMVKVAAHRLTERGGYFVLQPPGGDEAGTPLPFDAEGLTVGIMITTKGLEAAIQLVQRRPDLRWKSVSPEADFGGEVWKTAPAWAQARFQHQNDALPVSL